MPRVHIQQEPFPVFMLYSPYISAKIIYCVLSRDHALADHLYEPAPYEQRAGRMSECILKHRVSTRDTNALLRGAMCVTCL